MTATSRRRPGRPAKGDSPIDEQALLDLALESFAEVGFEATSVRELCRRADVSHNLIHHKFGSKEQLWYAAVDHGFASLTHELMKAVLDVRTGDDLVRLRAVLVRFVEVSATSPSLIRIINQEGARPGPRLDYVYGHYIANAMQLLMDMIDRLADEGRVRRIPRAVLYFMIANGATGPLTLPALAKCFPDSPATTRKADVRTYAESLVDLLFDGLRIDS